MDRRQFLIGATASAAVAAALPAVAAPSAVERFWAAVFAQRGILGGDKMWLPDDRTLLTIRSNWTWTDTMDGPRGGGGGLRSILPPGFSVDMFDHRRKLEVIYPNGQGPRLP